MPPAAPAAAGGYPGYGHPGDPGRASHDGRPPAFDATQPNSAQPGYPQSGLSQPPGVAGGVGPAGAPDPDTTVAYPVPGSPVVGNPVGGVPMGGTPMSGAPHSTSGTPSYGPFHSDTTTPDPYDFSTATFSGRRIEPSPPPDRSRLLLGVLAGLLAGLLVFGIGGFFTGRATAPNNAPNADQNAQNAKGTSPKLGVFEQSQVALNQPHFAGTGLVTISQGWLPYLSSCSRSGEPGGPALNPGEKVRVRCTLNGMSAIFVEYGSIADRDKARVKTLGQNVDARTLAPGVGPAVRRATPSGRTNGNYVEYAYKLTEGGVTRPVAAIWWDDARTPVAGYLLAYWKEGVGESWDPMRDLWARYA